MKLKKQLKRFMSQNRKMFIETGLSIEDANNLGKNTKWIGDLYKSITEITGDSKSSFNWVTGELQGQLRKLEITHLPNWVTAKNLSEIIFLVKEDKISFTSGKEILANLIEQEIVPEQFAIENNLIQENNIEEISKIVEEVIEKNSEVLERIANGEEKLIGFLVGQIIKISNGQVNASVAKELLLKEISS